MPLIETIFLGLIQGLTEFIPVSSSGHLVIGQTIFGAGSDHLFLEFINIGTLAALILYFRQRIINIIKDIFVNRNTTLARNILLTSIPAGLIGWYMSDFIASSWFFGSMLIVSITLIMTNRRNQLMFSKWLMQIQVNKTPL